MKQSIKITSAVAVMAMLILFFSMDDKLTGDKCISCCNKNNPHKTQEVKPGNYNRTTFLPVVNFFDFN